MPSAASGSPSTAYYSFNVGPVHFLGFDAERYVYGDALTATPTMQSVKEQYEWIVQDLAKAQSNRQQQPWIVVFAHRPMYCTNIVDDWSVEKSDCAGKAADLRDGVAFDGGSRQYGLEKLFRRFQVDAYFSGHMHNYERSYPVYRQQRVNTHYRDNEATVHLVVGGAGAWAGFDVIDEDTAYPWSAVRSDSYGYGVLEVYNHTHLHWAQLLDEDESVLDELWLIKQPVGGVGELAGTESSDSSVLEGQGELTQQS